MINTFLLITKVVETTTAVESTVNMDEMAAQVMLETPPLQLLGIGLLSVAAFMGFFVLVFYVVSSILNLVVSLNDKYYEKTGKKRPVNKRKKKGKNF